VETSLKKENGEVKQTIDPRLAIGVIAVIVLIAAGLLWRSYSGTAAAGGPAIVHPAASSGGVRARIDEMRNAHTAH
jgi:hypothetical protein